MVASLWQVQGGELGTLLGEFDALAAVACGARVAVVGEAESRGEMTASQAGSTAGWVAEHAPTSAGVVARLGGQQVEGGEELARALDAAGLTHVASVLPPGEATLLALLEEAPAHTPQAPEKRALEILKRMQGR